MLLLFFILFPFLAFVYSCTNLRSRINQVIFVMFFGLFGYCHTFADHRADAFRKHEAFLSFDIRSYSEVLKLFSEGEIKDVFESLLYVFVKSFTDDPHVMMAIVGMIGGFFYMLVVKRFMEDRKEPYSLPIIILLLFVVIESNIVVMGGIRYFVAFPVFMYSTIRFLIDRKKQWIIGVFLTPLIHFSYIIVVPIVLLVWLIKLPNSILNYLAIAICAMSLFMDTSSYAGAINTFVEMAMEDNEAISDRVESYSEYSTMLHFERSLTTRLIRINNKIGTCFIILFLLFMWRRKHFLNMSDYDKNIYNITLVFLIVSYALISFSVVGQRFVYISMVLLYFLMLNIYQRNMRDNAIRILIYAMPIVYSLHIAWFFYNCYCNTGLGIFIKPLPILLI